MTTRCPPDGRRRPSAGGAAALTVCYYAAFMVAGGLALYGSARLVGILAELFAARAELAEQAVARDRLRMSRDLHDLLGQSLSAVSLKGDLAIRLLAADPPAAQRELESLTSVARSALRDRNPRITASAVAGVPDGSKPRRFACSCPSGNSSAT